MNRLLLAALVLSMANAYPGGAPLDACVTLEPQHDVTGQTTPSPYAFVPVSNGDGTYQVDVTDAAGAGFKGFIIQARAAGSTTPVGTFDVVPADAHTLDCSGLADTVTHSINETRTGISFSWNSGGADVSTVAFHGAVVEVRVVYWAGLQSVELGTLP